MPREPGVGAELVSLPSFDLDQYSLSSSAGTNCKEDEEDDDLEDEDDCDSSPNKILDDLTDKLDVMLPLSTTDNSRGMVKTMARSNSVPVGITGLKNLKYDGDTDTTPKVKEGPQQQRPPRNQEVTEDLTVQSLAGKDRIKL